MYTDSARDISIALFIIEKDNSLIQNGKSKT